MPDWGPLKGGPAWGSLPASFQSYLVNEEHITPTAWAAESSSQQLATANQFSQELAQASTATNDLFPTGLPGAAASVLSGVVGQLFAMAGGFFQGFAKQLVSDAGAASGTYVIGLAVAMVVVFVMFR